MNIGIVRRTISLVIRRHINHGYHNLSLPIKRRLRLINEQYIRRHRLSHTHALVNFVSNGIRQRLHGTITPLGTTLRHHQGNVSQGTLKRINNIRAARRTMTGLRTRSRRRGAGSRNRHNLHGNITRLQTQEVTLKRQISVFYLTHTILTTRLH